MIQLTDIQSPIKRELERFSEIFNQSLESDNEIVKSMSSYILSMQGKQMRPLFLLLSAALHSGINEKSYAAATFIELVHTSSLIHDDIVDEAFMRRGKRSILTMQRNKVAVLLGDYVLSKGLNIAIANKLYKSIEMVSTIVEEMSIGELMQTKHTIKLDITSKEYFDIIKRKTAMLLAACGASGAITAGADEEEVDRMYLFGETLGIAFQIKDDILDLTPSSDSGKIACNDIKERKLTLPVISILENGNGKDRQKLIDMIHVVHKDNSIATKIRDFVVEKGGIKMAEQELERLLTSALGILDHYEDSPIKEALANYARFIITRNK